MSRVRIKRRSEEDIMQLDYVQRALEQAHRAGMDAGLAIGAENGRKIEQETAARMIRPRPAVNPPQPTFGSRRNTSFHMSLIVERYVQYRCYQFSIRVQRPPIGPRAEGSQWMTEEQYVRVPYETLERSTQDFEYLLARTIIEPMLRAFAPYVAEMDLAWEIAMALHQQSIQNNGIGGVVVNPDRLLSLLGDMRDWRRDSIIY